MEGALITDGGLQYVPQIAIQYIYLDFDGELTSYNGEILTVDDVEVKDSALREERIKNILAKLNAKYADQSVVFVTEPPETAEYSTIFIGKTTAFDQYGNFAGLAETIDEGNADKTDNAFVNLDSAATDTEIIATISHETDHLLGTLTHKKNGVITGYAMELNLAEHIAEMTRLAMEYKAIVNNLGNLENAAYQAHWAYLNNNVYSGGRHPRISFFQDARTSC